MNAINYIIQTHLPARLTSCRKKMDPAEEEIKMNEERIQKLKKVLRNISKDLKAQLQRKSLLLGTKHSQSIKPIILLH